jgi:hypothetical protein
MRKRLHQVDPECQLIDLFSSVVPINYHGIQKSSEQLEVPFVQTLSFYEVRLQQLILQIDSTHPLIIISYTGGFLCLFTSLCDTFQRRDK